MRFIKKNIAFFLAFVVLVALSFVFCFRIDLTSDHRYSIAPQTKRLMQNLQEPLNVTVYLSGDLNAGFFRLKRATTDLLAELAVYSKSKINVKYVNTDDFSSAQEQQEFYKNLIDKGLEPTNVYERDKAGKIIQKTVFPCLEITYRNRTLPVSLLKNLHGFSGEENLNISIENLEFEITDVIRQLTNRELRKIAFIEGHGELSEAETYDISKALNRYFQIDRGKIGNIDGILDNYKTVIVAGAKTAFSETEKFILDQYLMRGGRILWLLDGVKMEEENLSKSGVSPAMALDVNLSDQLFRYGVRIEPVLLQDVQCATVPVNIAPRGEKPQFEPTPFFYAPLLLASPTHSISKNITEVRSEFPSPISLVGNNQHIKAYALLFTSDNTHVQQTPAIINLGEMPKADDRACFSEAYVPVAVLLEGEFDSNFTNRILPKDLQNVQSIEKQSFPTKQIIIASRSIMRNETNGIVSDSTTLPLGYDRFTDQTFGNREFLQNAVLYLAGDENWLSLRNRSFRLRLLNKNLISSSHTLWKVINVVLPLVILAIFGVAFLWFRKRKYTK